MRVLVIALGLVAMAVVVAWALHVRTIRDLERRPEGKRAKKVMLLTLPSGRTFPVNYLRDPGVVWAAADTTKRTPRTDARARGSITILLVAVPTAALQRWSSP